MTMLSEDRSQARETDVTTRLDRLPWSPFHRYVAIALGIVWLLDAFEVNIIGSVLPTIQRYFNLGSLESSLVVSVWLIGVMFGAFFFGYLSDSFGRRPLFMITLSLYAVSTLIAALSINFPMFLFFRFLTAIAVGAEYSAINTAITEFIPSARRGRVNARVQNFWNIGSILSALVSLVFLNLLPETLGWRLAFAFGAIAAVTIIWVRRLVPESPRWLVSRGRVHEAEQLVRGIEARVTREVGMNIADLPPAASKAIVQNEAQPFWAQVQELLRRYPGRVALGGALDFSEAFGYYGIFAFFPLAIAPAVGISESQVPLFFLAGTIGALFGGFMVVGMIDRLGRKVSVPLFYTLAAITAVLMWPAAATGSQVIVLISFIFANCFAGSAWISAYPTFAEFFPTHLRATGIGLSVAIGRLGGTISAPLLVYVATQTPLGLAGGFTLLAFGWLIGAIAMIPWYFRGVEGAGAALEDMQGDGATREATLPVVVSAAANQ